MSTGKRIAVFPEPGAIGPVMNLVGICQGLRDLGHECIFALDPQTRNHLTSSRSDEFIEARSVPTDIPDLDFLLLFRNEVSYPRAIGARSEFIKR